MLNFLKEESNMTYTENGGTAYRSTESSCLDMFFKAGAMRNSTAGEIADVVTRAYAENPDKTMKIVFFARDARGGLGERRFFRCAVSSLVKTAPRAVEKNIPLFAEYGRYDDLCILLGTPLENAAAKVIKAQLDKDIAAMKVNAIIGRGTRKDFIDLYVLLQHYSLAEIMDFYRKKYPDFSEYRAILSMTYFEDAEIQDMPLMFIDTPWEEMKKTIIKAVNAYQQ